MHLQAVATLEAKIEKIDRNCISFAFHVAIHLRRKACFCLLFRGFGNFSRDGVDAEASEEASEIGRVV